MYVNFFKIFMEIALKNVGYFSTLTSFNTTRTSSVIHVI